MSFNNTYSATSNLLDQLNEHLNTTLTDSSDREELADILDNSFIALFSTTGSTHPINIDKAAWKTSILKAFGERSTSTLPKAQAGDLSEFITRLTVLFVHFNKAGLDLTTLTNFIANICGRTNQFYFREATRICDALIISLAALKSDHVITKISQHFFSALPNELVTKLLSAYENWISTAIDTTNNPAIHSVTVIHYPEFITALFEAFCFNLLALPSSERAAELTFFKANLPHFTDHRTIETLIKAFYFYYPHEHGALSHYLHNMFLPNDSQSTEPSNIKELCSKIEVKLKESNYSHRLPDFADLGHTTALEAFLRYTKLKLHETSLTVLNVSRITSSRTPLRPTHKPSHRILNMSTAASPSTLHSPDPLHAHNVNSDFNQESLFIRAGSIQLAKIINNMEEWCKGLSINLTSLEIFSAGYLELMGAIWHIRIVDQNAVLPTNDAKSISTQELLDSSNSNEHSLNESLLIEANANKDLDNLAVIPGLDLYYWLIDFHNFAKSRMRPRNPLAQLFGVIANRLNDGKTLKNFFYLLKLIAPTLLFPAASLPSARREIFLAITSYAATENINGITLEDFAALDRLAGCHSSNPQYFLNIVKILFPTIELPEPKELNGIYLIAADPLESSFFTSDRSWNWDAKRRGRKPLSSLISCFDERAFNRQIRLIDESSLTIPHPIAPSKEILDRIFTLFDNITAGLTSLKDMNGLLNKFLIDPQGLNNFFPAHFTLKIRRKIFQGYLDFIKAYPHAMLRYYKKYKSAQQPPKMITSNIGIDNTSDETQLTGLKGMVALFNTKSNHISIQVILLILLATLISGLAIVSLRLFRQPSENTALDQGVDIGLDCTLGFNGLVMILEIYRRARPSLQAVTNLALLNNKQPDTKKFFAALVLPTTILCLTMNMLYGALYWLYEQQKRDPTSVNILLDLGISGIAISLLSYLLDGTAIGAVAAFGHYQFVNRDKNMPRPNTTLPLLSESQLARGGFSKHEAAGQVAAVASRLDGLLGASSDTAKFSPPSSPHFLLTPPPINPNAPVSRSDVPPTSRVARTLSMDGPSGTGLNIGDLAGGDAEAGASTGLALGT